MTSSDSGALSRRPPTPSLPQVLMRSIAVRAVVCGRARPKRPGSGPGEKPRFAIVIGSRGSPSDDEIGCLGRPRGPSRRPHDDPAESAIQTPSTWPSLRPARLPVDHGRCARVAVGLQWHEREGTGWSCCRRSSQASEIELACVPVAAGATRAAAQLELGADDATGS